MELAVKAAAASGGFGAIGEPLEDVGMFVDELCVEGYAGIGIDAGFADLLNLVFAERLALLILRMNGRGKKQTKQNRGNAAERTHRLRHQCSH